jgi:peptidyl-tRNA hydrolase, PTH1 family
MKVVVGLGNPGPRYRGTRHNIGFAVIDEVARRAGVAFESAPVEALIAKVRPAEADGEPVLLAKPLTFMNASGQAVGELLHYFKIDPVDLLVVVDEVQLPLAKLRARPRGSAGGHNGLKSIVGRMGQEFPRLRIGVGRGDDRRDLSDHVLARFDASEAADVEAMTARAADAIEAFLKDGIEAVMNRFNAPGEQLDKIEPAEKDAANEKTARPDKANQPDRASVTEHQRRKTIDSPDNRKISS